MKLEWYEKRLIKLCLFAFMVNPAVAGILGEQVIPPPWRVDLFARILGITSALWLCTMFGALLVVSVLALIAEERAFHARRLS